MSLWTDVINPADLTGYVRADVADYEVNRNTLSLFLPNQTIADINVRFTTGSLTQQDAAMFQAYDTESRIGRAPTRKRQTIELPPLGDKVRVGEYDRLRGMGQDSNDNVLITVQKAAIREGRAVSDRIELARGGALTTGKVTINENGVIQEADFGRAAGHTVTASTLWSTTTAAASTMLATWQQTYTDATGMPPGAIVTSTRVLLAMQKNDEIRADAGIRTAEGGGARLIGREGVNGVLTSWGLPPVYVYDRAVRVNGVTTKVIPDDRLLFLPAPTATPDGTDLGGTWWGRTLESMEPDYGLAPFDQPGIVVGTYKTHDPIGVWVHSKAIGLPVLANPDLSFVARVL